MLCYNNRAAEWSYRRAGTAAARGARRCRGRTLTAEAAATRTRRRAARQGGARRVGGISALYLFSPAPCPAPCLAGTSQRAAGLRVTAPWRARPPPCRRGRAPGLALSPRSRRCPRSPGGGGQRPAATPRRGGSYPRWRPRRHSR